MPGPLQVTQLTQVGDFARSYLWFVQFPNIPGGGDARSLKVLAETASIPGVSNEAIELTYMAMKFKIAGRQSYDHTLDMTFRETSTMIVSRALLNWHKQITDNTLGIGKSPNDYKIDGVQFHLLDPSAKAIAVFNVNGMYLENLPSFELNYDSSEIIKRSATFSFDTWDLL